MKSRIKYVLLIVAILALLLVAAAPFQANDPGSTAGTGTGASPLTLPAAVGYLLTAAIGYLLTNGLKSLTASLRTNKYFTWVPDLAGLSVNLTTAIVTSIILFANTLLAALPPEWVTPVSIFITAVALPLLAYGVHYLVKGFQPPQAVG